MDEKLTSSLKAGQANFGFFSFSLSVCGERTSLCVGGCASVCTWKPEVDGENKSTVMFYFIKTAGFPRQN